MNRLGMPALFLALWAFHLHAAGGALVPYRDTGEMVTAAHTLGVAHPPGYPLYTLLGRAAMDIPWGNPAYRLNLLSAAAAALSGVVLFGVAGGGAAGLTAAALWATCPVPRELAAVSEMYTPAFLALAVLLWLARRALEGRGDVSREVPVMFFVFGAACGIRTDFALMVPAFAFLLWSLRKQRPPLGWAMVCFLAGLSVFLYLPLRSAREPWLDWNNPEQLENLIGSLTRRTHGGTLDLLSKSYGTGENFWPELVLYAKHAAAGLAWLGVPLALLGLRTMWSRSRAYTTFLGIVFIVYGPVFLFMANMPPNPHAVAIVEAHYPPSLMVLAILAAAGASALPARGATRWIAGALLLSLPAWNLHAHQARAVKRWNMAARDYVTSLFRAARPGSVGVLREDVPLFAAWERTLVAGARPDLTIVAQGLAASPWYRAMLKRQGKGVLPMPLRRAEDWSDFIAAGRGRPFWVSGDVNTFQKRPDGGARGLAVYLVDEGSGRTAAGPLAEFAVQRGELRQDRAPDFFTSDLAAEYAQAAYREASDAMKAEDWTGAGRSFLDAARRDPESPMVPFNRGYLLFQRGDREAADAHYARAARLYEETLRRAAAFRTLPDVVRGIREEAAEVWIHRGVVAEKLGRLEDARGCYARAVDLHPGSAQAHYNWAVTYWNRDWGMAVTHLERAVERAPSNTLFQGYLTRARSFRDGNVPGGGRRS